MARWVCSVNGTAIHPFSIQHRGGNSRAVPYRAGVLVVACSALKRAYRHTLLQLGVGGDTTALLFVRAWPLPLGSRASARCSALII